MRVTGGKFGGRELVSPPDRRVRPTSDRVRQAIFNILNHRDFDIGFSLEGAKVADLFAGTGALGIEALSHGAKFCLFVDESAESRALIRTNVESLHLTGATKIWRRNAVDLGPLEGGAAFDLVFLDPPYRKDLIPAAFKSLKAGGWLTSKALIVAECALDEDIAMDGFRVLDSRNYGETRILFCAKD